MDTIIYPKRKRFSYEYQLGSLVHSSESILVNIPF